MATTPILCKSRLKTPGAGAFAVLFGLESFSRALITVALPVQTLQVMGSDEGVSALFLAGSVAALAMAFTIPQLTEWLGRARLSAIGILLLAGSSALFVLQELPTQAAGFVLRAGGFALLYAGLSLFIMEHIRRKDLSRSEPVRMLAVGIAWTVGPLLGVQIESLWGPWAPFAASGLVVLGLFGYFRFLGFRNRPLVAPPKRRGAENPFANLAVFLAQPRLVLSFAQASGRTFFWLAFVIYTPLYAVATGLGAETGGVLVAMGSAFMLLMPLWGWFARRFGIRRVSVIAFSIGAVCMAVAGLLSSWPLLGAACIIAGACAMTVIDGYGNALFFRACRSSQRVAMTPIFSAQRNVAEVIQAGIFAILLTFFPIQVVYLTLGVVLFGLAILSTRIHARL